MILSEIKRILTERDLQLTKSLGQNFLHDGNQLRRIAGAGELHAEDKVLEIGPGLGPLTDLLVGQVSHVLAIEMDERLVSFLREKYADKSGLELLHGDALAYVRQHRQWAGWKLVANLPYCVASPILVELAQAAEPPERIVVTLQMEVAQRICAPAADDHYGVMSLLMQVCYAPRGIFKIPSSCFFPEPEVDSACIVLEKRPEPLVARERQAAFVRLVKCAFSQRRKMMMKLLKQFWPAERLTAAFAELGLDVKIRAERVSLDQFSKLLALLDQPRLK